MELRTYLSFPLVVVASLALKLQHSDYQWLLTTNNRHFVSLLKRGSFEIMSGKGSSMRGINFLSLEKQAFSPKFSHTSALKLRLA